MSSYAGANLFGSGPHAFRFGAWERSLYFRSFAGVDGELPLDLGLRFRKIIQAGRLQAESASALHALLDAVNAHSDGSVGALADNYGRSYPRAILERFETTTPVQTSRGFYCDYQIEYRQLP